MNGRIGTSHRHCRAGHNLAFEYAGQLLGLTSQKAVQQAGNGDCGDLAAAALFCQLLQRTRPSLPLPTDTS